MPNKIFRIYREDGHIIIRLLGLKIKFSNPLISGLRDCCSIPNLDRFLENNTNFPHPLGIVIAKDTVIGKNCVIYQNVSIVKKNGLTAQSAAVIGDNVRIYANACIIGDVKIGDYAIIGAGAVVTKDVPEKAIVVGNPAKVLRYRDDV